MSFTSDQKPWLTSIVRQQEQSFIFLRTFITELGDESGDELEATNDSARMDCFCELTRFSAPKSKSRTLLLTAVKACDAALRPLASPVPIDVSWHSNRAADLEWAEAGEAFRFVERLHDTLDHWDCDCFAGMSHRHAKFAFDLGPPGHRDSVAGTIYYPTMNGEGNKRIWHSAHMEFQERSDSPFPRSPALRSHGPASTSLADREANELSHLCGLLDEIAISGEGSVKLAAGKPKLCEAPEHAAVFQGLLTDGESSLVDCYNLPQPQKLLRMNFKHRISVALVLSYAYLHLGGGAWWPYDKKPNLHSPEIASEDVPPSRLVFFTPNFTPRTASGQLTQDEELPFVLTAFNAEMPSLPAFGKLLLELYLGQSVTWDELNTRLERARGEVFAKEILQAVTTCLAIGTDKTFKGGGTIRGDERLRTYFVKEVVMPIQYVLRVGYQLKPQDIFHNAGTSGVIELKERPIKRLKSHSPVRLDGPEQVPNDFCLHDGQEGMEELSKAQ